MARVDLLAFKMNHFGCQYFAYFGKHAKANTPKLWGEFSDKKVTYERQPPDIRVGMI